MPTRSASRPLVLVACALLLAGGLPAAARAGEPRIHDGFFLRLSGGFGYGSAGVDDVQFFGSSNDVTLSGYGGSWNFAIGGKVSTNLLLHGTLWGWSAEEPDVDVGDASGELDGTLALNAFGGGVTYYFMPANMYLSGSAGPAWLNLEVDGDDSNSDVGFALDVTLGKEWWVGNSWGLGLAGCFGYHTIPDDDVDANWNGASFGLRFSATLN